jgi:hypothetical protein
MSHTTITNDYRCRKFLIQEYLTPKGNRRTRRFCTATKGRITRKHVCGRCILWEP